MRKLSNQIRYEVWTGRDGGCTVGGVDNDRGDAPCRDGGSADGAAPKVAAARPAG